MRIRNPNAAPVVSPVTQADKDAVASALLTLAAKDAPTFDEVREAMPANKRARFTDGMLHQTALDSGLVVKTEPEPVPEK